MKTISINAVKRSELGKKGAKAARREGFIPFVIYGGDEIIHGAVTPAEVRHLIYSPDFKVAEVALDGQTYQCILKDYTQHPLTDEVEHIDFLRLVEGRTIKIEVPLRFKGASPGVKLGGKLIQNLRRIKLKTTPEYLVDEMRVDISTLQMGQSVRVRDIETNDNLEIMNAPGIPVATVEIPRAMRSAKAKEAKG